jgi:CelD/BcsL family acetyltransferase involved in cellulose biosynthesis
MNVDLVDAPARFAAIREEWNELLASSWSDSPFLTWEWLYPWWTHLGGSRRLAIVAVRDGGRLVAVAPFCVRRRLTLFRRWELLGTGCAGSDYLDAIVRKGREAEAARALADFVRARSIALRLEHLAPDSSLSRLAAPLVESGWTARSLEHGVCPYIRLAGHSWESFLATIGPSSRATTRRRLRLLDRRFVVQFQPARGATDRALALSKLFEFHEARFGRRGTAFRGRPLRTFHLDATERLAETGVLRLYTLRLDGAVAAVMYGLSFKQRFFFYQHGHDAKFHAHGVGRALLDLSIRSAIDEGLAEFDLLFGSESYKSAWTNDSRQLSRLDLFPAHAGGRLHRHAVETERTVRAVARRVISSYVPQAH